VLAALQVVLQVRRGETGRVLESVSVLLPAGRDRLVTVVPAWRRGHGPGPAAEALAQMIASRGLPVPAILAGPIPAATVPAGPAPAAPPAARSTVAPASAPPSGSPRPPSSQPSFAPPRPSSPSGSARPARPWADMIGADPSGSRP
jgi:hypothetical protein